MGEEKLPRRSSRPQAASQAGDPVEDFKRNQAVFAQYLEQILLDSRSPVWERILDGLSTHGSARVAGAVVSGVRLDDDTRADLARALLRDTIQTLGLDPELLAKLGNALNDPLVSQRREQRGALPTPAAEQQFKRAAGRLVVSRPDEE